MIRKPSSRIFYRYFSSTCSEKERLRVEAWAKSNSRNEESFGTLKTLWEISGQINEEWDPLPHFEKVSAKVGITQEHPQKEGNVRLYRITPSHNVASSPVRIISQVAAGFVLLIGMIFVVQYLKTSVMESQSKHSIRDFVLHEVHTKPGQQVGLDFDDGTKVVLNSASELRYGISPDGSREVYLVGEAFFDVHHSDIQPFVLHVKDGTIRDIGTRFDVEAWPDDDYTLVSVLDGEISIRSKARAEHDIEVTRNQYCIVSNNGVLVPPTHTNVSRTIEWMKGKLAFHNDPFSEVIKQIQRNYGVRCFVSDSSILSRRITTSFASRDPIKQVLDVISLSLDLTCKVSGDSVFFLPAKPILRWNTNRFNTKDGSNDKENF